MKFFNLIIFNKNWFLGFFTFVFSFGVSFFIISQYQNFYLKNVQLEMILSIQQQELLKIKKELGMVRFENKDKVDELSQKITAEEKLRRVIEEERKSEEKIAQNKIISLEKKISQTGRVDTSSVIKNWNPIVAYIACDFGFFNSPVRYQSSGSGIALKFKNDSVIKILTNRHVLYGPEFYILKQCSVKLPDSSAEFKVLSDDIQISASEYDWGILVVKNPDDNLKKVTSVFPELCQQKPALGDGVVVLGYPSIGSKNSITATDGIISGFDGNYFITSAKVEQGNSGGAAILTKENCLLGIPTFASLGQVESLARILDIWTVVNK